MRTLATLALLSTVALAGCEDMQSQTPVSSVVPQPTRFDAESDTTVQIKVPGLHCEHCAASACSLLKEMAGVVDVEADSESKLVTLSVQKSKFDSEAARASLEQQFGEATIVEDTLEG